MFFEGPHEGDPRPNQKTVMKLLKKWATYGNNG